MEERTLNLYFLGTGAGLPAKHRNVSSIALELLEERGSIWLFDCGEATQHRILYTNIKPAKIEKIFITHLHGDHIYGLPGLLGTRSFHGAESPLVIYGPPGIKEFVEQTLKLSFTHLKYPLITKEIFDDETVFEDDQFIVKVKKLEHGIPSFGYRIIEKDLPGTLLADRLKEIGVKPGPIYKKLKNGETVQLADGRVLNGKDFLGPVKKGRIVSILGDTTYCKQSVELSKDADVLVHEATFAKDEELLAYNYFHSTTVQAAQIALEANAKTLWLTHISSRYQGEEDCQMLLAEARAVFPEASLAHDFLCVPIPKK